ncbi:hypothetical protein F5887DRAFT_1083577 [Amanita rubescens]|nr:hypothetical protein F5887DRAFT_1083577 [Amanita rubescens]
MSDVTDSLRDKLFHYECMIQRGIKVGNILQLISNDTKRILETFEASTDAALAPIFNEYPLVQNFVISWVNEGEEPTFLEDWQESLRRGQNQRYRRPAAAPRTRPTTPPEGDSDQPLAGIISRQSRRSALPREDNLPTRTSALAPSRRRVTVCEPVDPSESDESSFPLSRRKSKAKAAKPLPSDAEMTATDGETLGRKVYHRRQPKANGNIHDPACSHCQRRRLQCLEDEYGGACVPCKKRKTGCTHSGVKGKRLSRKGEVGSETEKEVEEPSRKKRRKVRKNTDTDAEGLAKVKSSKRRRVEDMEDRQKTAKEAVKDHQKKVNQDDPPSGLEEAVEDRQKTAKEAVKDHQKKVNQDDPPSGLEEAVESRNPDDPPLGLEEAADDPPTELEYIDEEEAATQQVNAERIASSSRERNEAVEDQASAVEERMRQQLNTVESYFEHQVNVQARRFDVECQRMRHLEDMVHRVGDQLGSIVTRAGTRMTAHEVNAAERLERLEKLVVHLVEKVGEVCEYLGLEANKLDRLPSIEKRQVHVTWFGTPWPNNDMAEFLDQVAAASTEDAENGNQVVASTPPVSHSQVVTEQQEPTVPPDPVETPLQGGPAAPITLTSSPWTPLRLPPRTGALQTTLDRYISHDNNGARAKGKKRKTGDGQRQKK